MADEKFTLEYFLNLPLENAEPVMQIFRELEGAKYYPVSGQGAMDSFTYIPGTRKDRVLLVAHADTFFDIPGISHSLELEEGSYFSGNSEAGIGADDRAGCAILWLLRNMGHSLLITDGEEYGAVAAGRIATEFPDIYDELNSHCYMLEFDRRHGDDYKCYNIPVTSEFVNFIESETGYHDAGKSSSTDIVKLCRDICGVNLSVGYYYEHTPDECLVFSEWQHTLEIARKMLTPPQKRFTLKHN